MLGVGQQDSPQSVSASGVHHWVVGEGSMQVLRDLGRPVPVVAFAWGLSGKHVVGLRPADCKGRIRGRRVGGKKAAGGW